MTKRFHVLGPEPSPLLLRRARLHRRAMLLNGAAQGPVYTGALMVAGYILGLLDPLFAWMGLFALTAGTSLAVASVLICAKLERELHP